MIHEELSGKIIGAAMEVLNELKPGLDEKLYERAMVIELKRRGHDISIQKSFPVYYRGELIGNLIPDLIVDHARDRRSQGSFVLYRDACCANGRLSEHHRLGSGARHKFQERAPGLETCVASPSDRRTRHA